MDNSNSRRTFLKATGVSATAIGSVPVISEQASAYSVDLRVAQHYDDDRIDYVIEVDSPNCTKESNANDTDYVYNYSNYSRIEGFVLNGGSDTFSHDGRIRYLEAYAGGASVALRLTQNNTSYNREGTVDIWSQDGDVHTNFYTTGMVCGTGSGSLEWSDSFNRSDAYGESSITGDGHDKFDINGAFDEITMEMNVSRGFFDVTWGHWLQD